MRPAERIALGWKTTLDLRETAPQRVYATIMNAFDALEPDEALLFEMASDPKPLLHRFRCELRGDFTWDSVESGPQSWRVRLGKTEEESLEAYAEYCSVCGR